jgi:hypothetical protein
MTHEIGYCEKQRCFKSDETKNQVIFLIKILAGYTSLFSKNLFSIVDNASDGFIKTIFDIIIKNIIINTQILKDKNQTIPLDQKFLPTINGSDFVYTSKNEKHVMNLLSFDGIKESNYMFTTISSRFVTFEAYTVKYNYNGKNEIRVYVFLKNSAYLIPYDIIVKLHAIYHESSYDENQPSIEQFTNNIVRLLKYTYENDAYDNDPLLCLILHQKYGEIDGSYDENNIFTEREKKIYSSYSHKLQMLKLLIIKELMITMDYFVKNNLFKFNQKAQISRSAFIELNINSVTCKLDIFLPKTSTILQSLKIERVRLATASF